MHAEMNQPANAVQLDIDIEAMKKLYGTRGYMAASIQPDPELDDTNSTVRYVLHIQEGEVYSMVNLDIRGLGARMAARLEDDWELRGSDPCRLQLSQTISGPGGQGNLGVLSDWGYQCARIAQS